MGDLVRLLGLAVAFAATFTGMALAADAPVIAPPAPWVAQPAPLPPSTSPTNGSLAVRRVLSDFQVNFGPTGEELYFHAVSQFRTPAGLNAANLALTWRPDTDTLIVHRVQIIRNGKVIDLLAQGQTFTVLRREQNLEAAALDGVLTATMQPQGLQVGDTLDVAYTIRRRDPALQDRSAFQIAILKGPPIEHLYIREVWPTATPMTWRVLDGLPQPVVTSGAGQTELKIDATNVERPIPPAGAPVRFSLFSAVETTDFKGWSDVSRVLAPLFGKAEALPPDSPLHGEVERIRAASKDPVIQASAALQLVEDNVRYFYIGLNDGGYVPATADVTWSRRFGDCKGKTVLLIALLHGLGIDAEPELVSTRIGDGLNEHAPAPDFFDHVIVRATIGGRTYWLDPTRSGDADIRRLLVPPYKWALPLRDAGADLQPLIDPPLDQPQLHVVTTIDATGGLDVIAPATIEIRLHGDLATAVRLGIANVAKDQLEAAIRKSFSDQLGGMQVADAAVQADEATGDERIIVKGATRLDWVRNSVAGARQYKVDDQTNEPTDFTRPPGPRRDAPYAVPYPVFLAQTVTISLPQGGNGFTLVNPNLKRSLGGIEITRRSRIVGGVAIIDDERRSTQPEFPASEATADQAALAQIDARPALVQAPPGYSPGEAELRVRLARVPVTAAEFYDHADAALQMGSYKTAMADYDQAIALDPQSADALNARCYGRAEANKDLDKALADCNAALAIAPQDAATLDSRALVYFRLKQFDKAITDDTAALAAQADLASSLYLRGVAERMTGDAKDGDRDIADATRIDPGVTKTYAKWGVGP